VRGRGRRELVVANDAFRVLIAGQPEQVATASLNVARAEASWLIANF